MDLRHPWPSSSALFETQYIDLATNNNGYLIQYVNIPATSVYILAFSQKAYNTFYDTFKMEVYWDGTLLFTRSASTINITRVHL